MNPAEKKRNKIQSKDALAAHQAAYLDMYHREFFPYDDDDFLKQRLNARPRVIRKHPDLTEIMTDALVRDDDESLIEAADMVDYAMSEMSEPVNSVSSLIDYANYALAIDKIKVENLGSKTPADRENFLIARRTMSFFGGLGDNDIRNMEFATWYFNQRMQQLGEASATDSFDWLYLKSRNIYERLMTLQLKGSYIKNLPESDSREYEVGEVAADSERISELFKNVLLTRTHGMKLGYVPYKDGGSLIFNSSDNLYEQTTSGSPNVHPLMKQPNSLFQVTHSSVDRPKYLKPSMEVSHIGGFEMGKANFGNSKPLAILFVGEDGEIYQDDWCQRPMSLTAAKYGKYEQYRELQANVLAMYHDLTHSVEAASYDQPKDAASITNDASKRKDAMDAFGRLVIPRIHTATHTEPQTEVVGREVRIHDVVWHIRKLPNGWQPSPDAQMMAKEIGIILREGETFVRAHRRGTKELGEVAGHQLIVRHPSAI